MEKKNIGTGTGTVCVTGGTGYLGSWLVMRLLQRGYSVNTTVRSEIGFLTNLPGASDRLRIFEADLNQPDSFRAAIEGCVGVFLVAHQMKPDEKETEEKMTKRSITAALGILQACLDSKTVKRVVYTSSAATAMFSNKNSSIVDENSWSDVDLIHESTTFMASYMITKTLTERAALEFAEKHGLELVTVLPSWIHGPFIGPRCPSSVYTLMTMFFGNQEIYKYIAAADLVHVDDVASAHIFLLESPDAKGRYICSAVETTIDKLCEVLCRRYHEYQIPAPHSLGEIRGGKSCKISSKKLLDTGFKYKYGLEEMYDGAIECCKRLGLL
ncbi:hypothetical protein Pfo_005789 [Paulownia fortunei]|nr:hypothetical protein Pfo_005789 [Paulownia fortunei]